jgi:UDP-N-acetylmuramoylalanine--D-glutamate ligase
MEGKSGKIVDSLPKVSSADRLKQIRRQFVSERIDAMKPHEHAMELVSQMGGVSIINNSSSVDIESTWYAMDQIDGKIIWIAGGVDRGNNYNLIKEIVHDKVTAIIVLGNHNMSIFKFFNQAGPSLILNASTIDEALEHSVVIAKRGDTILFSPGCPSYDLYENYEQRGSDFKRAVDRLIR